MANQLAINCPFFLNYTLKLKDWYLGGLEFPYSNDYYHGLTYFPFRNRSEQMVTADNYSVVTKLLSLVHISHIEGRILALENVRWAKNDLTDELCGPPAGDKPNESGSGVYVESFENDDYCLMATNFDECHGCEDLYNSPKVGLLDDQAVIDDMMNHYDELNNWANSLYGELADHSTSYKNVKEMSVSKEQVDSLDVVNISCDKKDEPIDICYLKYSTLRNFMSEEFSVSLATANGTWNSRRPPPIIFHHDFNDKVLFVILMEDGDTIFNISGGIFDNYMQVNLYGDEFKCIDGRDGTEHYNASNVDPVYNCDGNMEVVNYHPALSGRLLWLKLEGKLKILSMVDKSYTETLGDFPGTIISVPPIKRTSDYYTVESGRVDLWHVNLDGSVFANMVDIRKARQDTVDPSISNYPSSVKDLLSKTLASTTELQTTETSTTETKAKEGSNLGLIIGIALGSTTIIGGIIAGSVFYTKGDSLEFDSFFDKSEEELACDAPLEIDREQYIDMLKIRKLNK